MNPTPRSAGILFVEDNPLLRKSILPFLKRLGFRVYPACSAPEAMDLWSIHSGEIDLLLADVNLPDGVSGLELAKDLRALRHELPVILSSGYSEGACDLDTGLGKGVYFLQKPYDPKMLSQIVSVAHQRAKTQTEPAL